MNLWWKYFGVILQRMQINLILSDNEYYIYPLMSNSTNTTSQFLKKLPFLTVHYMNQILAYACQ